MKIQCDACNREEASMFCSADEAALCNGCDRRVHDANKLASKHPRFSLLHPSYKEAPRCDICHERRAFLFCLEDRAILCRECDLPIHTANHLTQQHNRFLLTGIKLSSSSSSSSFSPVSSTSAAVDSSQQAMKGNEKENKQEPVSSEMGSSLPPERSEDLCTSSISEYLLKILPGWRVEDLLGSSSPADGLCETDEYWLRFTETDDLDNHLGFVSNDFGIWVPQVPHIHSSLYPAGVLNSQIGVGMKHFKEAGNVNEGQRWRDDAFTVPQMSPPCKRPRPPWQIG